MKNLQIFPINQLSFEDFELKTSSIAEELNWKVEKSKSIDSLVFTTSPNLDSLLGNNIEVKYINPSVAVIIVSSKNKLQIAEGGDTTDKILEFITIFYKEKSI